MIKHIVLLSLISQGSDERWKRDAEFCKEGLESLNGKIEGMIKLEVGIDFSKTDSSSDLAIYSEFQNQESLEYYYMNSTHLEVKNKVDRLCNDRRIIDYISHC